MKYDLIIVGGGMVGASLAVALNKSNLKIALIDANSHTQLDDPRLIALTHGSCNLLKNVDIWPELVPYAAPIKHIHVSHRGRFGITRIHASDMRLDTLGHLVPAKYITTALEEKLTHASHIDVIRPAVLKNLTQTSDNIELTIHYNNETKTLHTKRVIGADGTHSTVRELLNIPTQTHDYEQSAIVTITELQRHHQFTAYERFLEQGAIAMLPLSDNACATIWTDSNENIARLMQLSDDEFLKTLQTTFGYRLGRFTHIRKRHTYPLKLVLAENYQQHNIILIGNAAHTLHPIASQGLNLALYEIAELTHQLIETPNLLHDFTKTINVKQKISTQLSHRLPWLFSTDFFIINVARQLAMLGLDSCKQAKEFFMRNSMGRAGRMPPLLTDKDFHEKQHTDTGS